MPFVALGASVSEARPQLRYHWLRLRATCHPTEDPEAVKRALRTVAGIDERGFATALQERGLETHHGLPLSVFELVLDRSRDVRDVLQRILALEGARARLLATVDARTDDDGVFYARLDKQAAARGLLVLLDAEDAVQLRLKMETYPATRVAALQAVQSMLASDRP